MQVIVDRIRTTLPAVNDDILEYITGIEISSTFAIIDFHLFFRHSGKQ